MMTSQETNAKEVQPKYRPRERFFDGGGEPIGKEFKDLLQQGYSFTFDQGRIIGRRLA